MFDSGPPILRIYKYTEIGGSADLTKNSGIYNLNSVISTRLQRILASQNRVKSPFDEIFNIDRFLE